MMYEVMFQQLFYALLHSVWLGLIIAGGLALYLRGSRADQVQQRYVISCMAMLALVLAVFVTWSVLGYEPVANSELSRPLETEKTFEPIAHEDALLSRSAFDSHAGPTSNRSESVNWPRYGLFAWAFGVFLMLWRLIYRIGVSRQLCCRGQVADSPEILRLVTRICGRMDIARRIKILFSDEMMVPCAVGCLKPVIVLPMSIATGFVPEQLEAILAHELAHIRRWDYWVNCVQLLIESLLFFNPAVWWISYHIRQEREACCDAMAAQGMGQPMTYVQALVAWIGQAQQQPLNAALAFSGPSSNGRLVDRVKRLAVRDYKASLNLSWVTSGLMLVLSALVLVGLKLGADQSVAFAAKVLTPQQRIEKAERLAQDFDRDHSRRGQEGYQKEKPVRVRISGKVRTYDGKPLKSSSQSKLYCKGLNNNGLSSGFRIKKNGTYFAHVYAGRAWLLFTVEGYAPQGVGPISTVDVNSIENLDVVLQEGFDASLKIVDVKGMPVEQARVYGGYKLVNDSLSLTIDRLSDAEGLIHFEKAAGGNVLVKCTIMADGFGECAKEIKLKPNQTTVITLSPIEPATGVVVSKKTGEPIANAEIRPVRRRLGGAGMSHSDRGEVLARTGQDGQFKLTRLAPEAVYALSARAPGYGYRFIDGISAGKDEIKFELPGPVGVLGEILGPLETLPRTKEGQAYISYSERSLFKGSHDSLMNKKAIVRVQDGKGVFELTDLWGTHVSIGSGYYAREIALADERQNVTIDLVRPENRKDSKLIKRKVIFKFVLDENTDKPEETSFVSPSGSLEIKYTKMHLSGQRHLYSQYAEIDKGQAVCDVVTLDHIDCTPHDIKGFWFKKKTIKLTASKDPLVVHIPCVEAGAILGQIQGADRGFARLNVVKRATSKETGLSGLESQRLGLDGKFMVSPVPLGGTYRIVASHNQTYMVSEAITLTKAEPFKTLQMELPKGQEVVCTVLDPNGAPCSNLEYTFNHHVDGMGGSGGHGGLYTNASGQIVLPGVNFAAPITYSITMRPKDYQPVKHALSQATLNSPIHLKKGLHVDGVVRDEEDRPVPGLEVYCMLYHNKAWAWVTYVEAEAKTDAQGRFQFNNLPPGNYTLGCRSAKEIGETAIVAGQKKQAIVRIENRG